MGAAVNMVEELQELTLMRRDEDQGRRRPGGHAAERRRQFERERGLPESGDSHLDEEMTGGKAGDADQSQEDELSSDDND